MADGVTMWRATTGRGRRGPSAPRSLPPRGLFRLHGTAGVAAPTAAVATAALLLCCLGSTTAAAPTYPPDGRRPSRPSAARRSPASGGSRSAAIVPADLGRETIFRRGRRTARVPVGAFGLPPAAATVAACDGGGGGGVDDVFDSAERPRTRRTSVDAYYAEHGELPPPPVAHVRLPAPDEISDDSENGGGFGGGGGNREGKGILVVGDVHGCLSELRSLHDLAVRRNGGAPFRYVVCVGDLCNKGPDSAGVVRHVREREREGWRSVRGNHDESALRAACGDEEKRGRRGTYGWVMEGEEGNAAGGEVPDGRAVLSDDDVVWMSQLPYTITIPASLLDADAAVGTEAEEGGGKGVDTIVVHAGLVPGVALEHQDGTSMVNMRDVVPLRRAEGILANPKRNEMGLSLTEIPPAVSYECYPPQRKQNERWEEEEEGKTKVKGEPTPWASVWEGPQRVIFGHDARRGYQRYVERGDWTIGLDTGAVYGKRLSGIMLPSREVLSVDAEEEHCPVG